MKAFLMSLALTCASLPAYSSQHSYEGRFNLESYLTNAGQLASFSGNLKVELHVRLLAPQSIETPVFTPSSSICVKPTQPMYPGDDDCLKYETTGWRVTTRIKLAEYYFVFTNLKTNKTTTTPVADYSVPVVSVESYAATQSPAELPTSILVNINSLPYFATTIELAELPIKDQSTQASIDVRPIAPVINVTAMRLQKNSTGHYVDSIKSNEEHQSNYLNQSNLQTTFTIRTILNKELFVLAQCGYNLGHSQCELQPAP